MNYNDIKLPPLPPLYIAPSVQPVDYPEVAQALIDYARAAIKADRQRRDKALQADNEKLRKDAEQWRSISQKRELGKKYGCHCDLEEGMEPDGCVIDSGERHHCIYAKTVEVKEQCEYWRVIVTDKTIDAAMAGGKK